MTHLDPETLHIVLGYGFAFAVFSGVLYFLTAPPQTKGLRIFPASLGEWVAYWFRLLEMTIVAGLILVFHSALRETGLIVFATAFWLLFASVVVFWRRDHPLCVFGAWVLVLAVLGCLCLPAGSTLG